MRLLRGWWVVGGMLHLADAMAQRLTQLRQLAWSENNQHDDQDDDEMWWFKSPHNVCSLQRGTIPLTRGFTEQSATGGRQIFRRFSGSSADRPMLTIARRVVPDWIWRYGCALAATAAALLLAWLMAPSDPDGGAAALLFLAAVGVSGWYGGLGPALLATAFGAMAIDYFFEMPRYQVQVTAGQTLTDLLAFL